MPCVHPERLNWKTNTEAGYKKGMSSLRFLTSFYTCSIMLEISCQWVVVSSVSSAVVCRGSSISAGETNK